MIAFAYYLSYVTHFSLPLESYHLSSYIGTVALTIASTFIVFSIFGVYKGVWRYVSINDASRIIASSMIGALLSAILVRQFYPFDEYSGWIYFLYALLLVFIMLSSRFSFRFLDRAIRPISPQDEVSIFIYGAGDAGEFALKECQQNQGLGYNPVGFLDDDPLKKGRSIHGLSVLGGIEKFADLIDRHHVKGVIIASSKIEQSEISKQILDICKEKEIWVRRLRFEFEKYI